MASSVAKLERLDVGRVKARISHLNHHDDDDNDDYDDEDDLDDDHDDEGDHNDDHATLVFSKIYHPDICSSLLHCTRQ